MLLVSPFPLLMCAFLSLSLSDAAPDVGRKKAEKNLYEQVFVLLHIFLLACTLTQFTVKSIFTQSL